VNTKHGLGILIGLSLVLPLQFNAFAVFEPDRRDPTAISLDLIEQCLNTMTCNAQVFTGTTIKFTGMLTDEDGDPLPDMAVNIVALIPTPEIMVLAETTTDIDGLFEVEWVAKLSKQESAFTDVTKQFLSESVTVLAQFPGSEDMAPSKSNKITMSVTVNTLHTIVNSDKTLYNEGDTATIFIAFLDSSDNFVDPESILGTLNNVDVVKSFEKKKEGSYVFTISAIEKKHQQLIIVPETEGFNSTTAYLTIIVGGLR